MRIPKQAKIVFKGKIFDVYQWPQKMYDGSVATFEMLKRPGAVRVIAIKGDKIILNQEKQPAGKKELGTFGGRVDEGETPLACAKRELLEEAGMKSDDWKLLSKEEFYPDKMDFTVYTFVARDCKKIQEPAKDPGEKIKIIAVDFDKFIKITLDKNSPMTKQFALRILRMKYSGELNKFKQKLFTSLHQQSPPLPHHP